MSFEGQGNFLALVQGYLCIKIETCFSQKPDWAIFNQILCVFLGYKEMKINQHDAGHMTKTAAMPIYGINT